MGRQSKILRKQRRQHLQQGNNLHIFDSDPVNITPIGVKNFDLQPIQPLTDNQHTTFKEFANRKHLLLHGLAGTGKTFISLFLALDEILNYTQYNKLFIVRSAVPTRDQGFLPGDLSSKNEVFEAPYARICCELFNRGDAYSTLKHHGLVEFVTTSYVRGITIDNAIVIVDEAQNLTFHELDSIITRSGNNTQLIFCGDFRQSDLTTSKDREGLLQFIKILHQIDSFVDVEFETEDIVRSELVKKYIIAKDKLGIT